MAHYRTAAAHFCCGGTVCLTSGFPDRRRSDWVLASCRSMPSPGLAGRHRSLLDMNFAMSLSAVGQAHAAPKRRAAPPGAVPPGPTAARRPLPPLRATSREHAKQVSHELPNLVLSGIATAASAALLLAPSAVLADVQYVNGDQIMQQAKPLTLKQPVEKTKVWALFIGGAATLFGTTLVLENNGDWFPAISRANNAMRQMGDWEKQQQEQQMAPPEVTDIDVEEPVMTDDARLLAAVQAGLKDASEASSNLSDASSSESLVEPTPATVADAARAQQASQIPQELASPEARDDATPSPDVAAGQEALDAALEALNQEKQAADAAAEPKEPTLEQLEAALEAKQAQQQAEPVAPAEKTSAQAASLGELQAALLAKQEAAKAEPPATSPAEAASLADLEAALLAKQEAARAEAPAKSPTEAASLGGLEAELQPKQAEQAESSNQSTGRKTT